MALLIDFLLFFAAIPLHKELFSPIALHMFGSVDRIMFGLANQRAQSADYFISKQLTNHLFERPGAFGPGMDLFAMNIQRGREHGIPDYNKWRKICGLKTIQSFDDLRYVMHDTTAANIEQLYRLV